jgi:hypothetical protein
MKKGRMPDAWRAMRRLRFTDVQAARDLYYAYVQYEEERKVHCLRRFIVTPR